MLELILENNYFEFNDKYYLQTHATAMGTTMVVSYANIFMAVLEEEILKNAPEGQPRSQALPSCLRKDPGWGWSRDTRKFDRPRGRRQSIKLHASTSALYTSIARSESILHNQH
jgi:hypothetical protein